MLAGQGLQRFYELGGGRGQPVGAVPRPAAREWLTELEVAGRLAGGQVRLALDVQGIHCGACVWLLQRLWRDRDGGHAIEINPALGRAVLSYDPERLVLGEYLDAAEHLGYRFAPASKSDAGEEHGLLLRLGICVALALNAMMFALAGYTGMTAADGAVYPLFRWLSLGLAAVAVAVGGPVFFRGALAGVRHRVLHLDLPISLGIALAFGSSAAGVIAGAETGYLDTVTVFVALMLAGRYVQTRAVRRNRDYLLANDGADHLRGRRLRGGALEVVAVTELAPGDVLQLAPGDLLPVRARLLTERAEFSLDWIRGESEPVCFVEGAPLPAGAFCADRHAVRVVVEATAADSGLLELLTPGATGDGEVRGRDRFWARLNQVYVAAVLVAATAAAVLWWWLDPSRIVAVTTAVLVVTCPCALGLAIPLAFDLAVVRLRCAGIFVRNAALLDKARHVRKALFDKTGTLTWGGVAVVELRPVPSAFRDVLWTMVNASSHPVSRALARTLAASGPARLLEELVVETHPGGGLLARHDGRECRLGSRAFVLGDAARGVADDLLLLACDGHVEACFQVDEDLREGYVDEIAALRAHGVDVWLLSGDRPNKVDRVARVLGVPEDRARGGLSPEQKAECVRSLDRDDTLMVGDGLNDAPAFAAAFCAGTPAIDRPVLPSKADFFYAGGGAHAVTGVLDASRRLHRVVTTNLGLAVVYNVLALSLAFAGVMTPLLCAVLMPLSSVGLLAHTAARLAGPSPSPSTSESSET